jgi:tetratricopeptide (TPR) repeat protein
MVGTFLICCALLGLDNGEGGSSVGAPADRTAYDSARKTAGRDAGAHVRLALWCESHGLPSERMKHLALAVLYDPSHALARGLMGLVEYQGKWGNPEDVGKRIQDDPAYRALIREYLERRVQATHKADSQMRLAAWCEQKGLKPQAIAHYHEVVQLDPSREVAWRHLGYKKLGDRWVKAEEATAEKLEAERQRYADKRWRAKLEKLREGLEGKDAARRVRAERALSAVTDPRAVPMIWAVFVCGGERLQLAAVQMLGQIDGPAASTALATLAILYPEGQVSGRATETLTRRDPRDIVGRLISMIRKPFKYQVRPVNGPGSTGEIFVEGEQFNVRRLYRSTPVDPALIPAGFFAPSTTFNPLDNPGAGMSGTAAVANPRTNPGPDIMESLTTRAFASAGSSQGLQLARRLDSIRQENRAVQQRLTTDIQAIEQINSQFKQLNDRVLPIMTRLTGQDLGAEPEKWKGWWTDQLGYAYQAPSSTSKPTLTEIVDTPSWSASLECFGAGTLVRTIDGPRPIESIRVGDRLLSQKTSSGALAFQPVLAVHHTKSAPTLRISLDGETIVATGIHRFWKAGEGWSMARDLKPGDRVRVVGDVVKVRSVDTNPNQPVYNLDVAENHDFFVGSKGVLVHDSNIVQPVLEPFDR